MVLPESLGVAKSQPLFPAIRWGNENAAPEAICFGAALGFSIATAKLLALDDYLDASGWFCRSSVHWLVLPSL